MTKRRIVALVALALALGAASVLLIGAMLPERHRATVVVDLAAPPPVVWRLVRDVEASAAWRESVTEIRPLGDRPVETYAESSDFGVVHYQVESERAPSQLIMRIVDNDAFGGTWTYTLEGTAGDRTRLTVTEDGEIYSPLFRFFARFVFGYSSTLEAYARDIETAVASQPR